jgi:dTDP-4-dehydrorhamnose reductase
LITGASGIVGSYAARALYRNYEVSGLDIESTDIACFARFYPVDLRNTYDVIGVLDIEQPAVVIHAAAIKDIICCEQRSKMAREINVDASIFLHRVCRKRGIRFMFISSDIVFNGNSAFNAEDSTIAPINKYGLFKAEVEKKIIGAPRTSIIRTALVFGDIPNSQIDSFKNACLKDRLTVQSYIVGHVLHRVRRSQDIFLPDSIYSTPTSGDLLGRQISRALKLELNGILHCCGRERISRYEFGCRIARHFGFSTDCIKKSNVDDALRPKDVSLDVTRTQQMMGMDFDSIDEMLDASSWRQCIQ